MADPAQERTERPTPKRLKEAREKGDVPRSRELNTTAVLLASAGGLLLFGEHMVSQFLDILKDHLQIARSEVFDDSSAPALLAGAMFNSLAALAPLLVLLMLTASLAPLALGGWALNAKGITFSWEKLDPIKGLGRIFAWRGFVELAKALVKFLIVAAALVTLLWNKADDFLGLGNEALVQGVAHLAQLLAWSFLAMSMTLILIAAVDVPFQLWDHTRKLRMTRQEVKDELKEVEGRPEVKGRIRKLQQEMAQRRMMAEIPKADAIVTNPNHYAIALRYDAASMKAPIVVGKGVDLIAAQIRKVGEAHHVPMISAPPLARALYYSTEINQEVPVGLYMAVAGVLAYVFRLREYGQYGGDTPEPPDSDELPIPDDLRRK